jgi:hypothetical protein
MFPVYGGRCLSRKAVHNWVEKFSQGRLKVADDETEVSKWLRQVKRLLCCGFRCTGKAMWQVYQCWSRIYREMSIFSKFEYNMFYGLYISICDLFTDSPSAFLMVVYCNGFAQSVSRQQLGKNVPACNNRRYVSVDECYSSSARQWTRWLGITWLVFSVLSVRSLYKEDLL